MKGSETQGTTKNPDPTRRNASAAAYEQVFDLRKQRVRGIWKRGGVFYARFTATDLAGRKRDTFRALDGVTSPAAAKAELAKLKKHASAHSVQVSGRIPTFADYAERYHEEVSKTKRLATQRKERTHLDWWKERVGALPLNRVARVHVNSGVAELTKAGRNPRTVNLYIITLRSVLKRALEEGWIQAMPTAGLRALPTEQKTRELVGADAFEKILTVAPTVTRNGVEFADYLRFLLYTGSREKETLRVEWKDVDFNNEQVAIGADGGAKNRKPRHVDFNERLGALLVEMKERRAPDSRWLFPSPNRGDKDIPARSLRQALHLCCAAAGVGRVGFHDTRHRFISECVMAGVDYLTIARWVGHRDGGILIGKVYGHLSSAHRKTMAQRLSLSSATESDVIRLPSAV
jgi:integrase